MYNVCADVCMGKTVFQGWKVMSDVLLCCSLCYALETGSLTRARARPTASKCQGSSLLSPIAQSFLGYVLYLAFKTGAGHSNLGSHAFVASPLICSAVFPTVLYFE